MSIQLAMARLGEGEEIYVYSATDASVAVGPFTEADNTDLQVLGIPAVQGDSIVVEFTHPCDARQSQKGLPFVINKVSHGYKNFFGEDDQEEDVLFGRRRLQGCLEDVKCPLANGWEAPIRSVAKTYDGSYVCSGQLIGNAARTDTHYFLTANHCVSQANKAAGMVFYWNYECSTCGGSSCTGTRVSTSGSSIVATNRASDMT